MNSKNTPVVLHEQTRNYIYPESGNSLVFKVLTSAGEGITCELICWNRVTEDLASAVSVKADCYARDSRFSYHEAVIKTEESTRYLRYFFRIRTGAEVYYLNRYGLGTGVPETGCFEYQCTNELDVFQIPGWAGNAVCYQIFPERFYNGDPKLNPVPTVDWDETPDRENFLGGDLRGIIKKFGSIVELGINLIYLNPVFRSPSNHKYDTTDYFTVDPHFGTIDDLRELVGLCHKNDIRIVLDGVFNHCGFYFHGFQDLYKNGEESDYLTWFFPQGFPLTSEPLNYDCVGYYKWMPKLRMKNREVRDYFLRVGEYWIRETGIDGWRLDVADEVDYTFWEEFRIRIKELKPDALLIGETWTDGRNLLEGNQMDSVMNYQFRDAVIDFIAEDSIDSDEFDNRIMGIFGMYKRMVYPSLYNLLGSHDTPRFMTVCGNNRQKVKLAVVIQMTFPGMPAVYYGDETGMAGENDPGCRGGKNWDNPDLEIYSHYLKLIRIRREYESLRTGSYRTLYSRNRIYAYVRETDEQRIYVAINNSLTPVSFNLPVLDGDGLNYSSLYSGGSFIRSGIKSECKNPDMTICNDSVELQLGSYCFEIIYCKRSAE